MDKELDVDVEQQGEEGDLLADVEDEPLFGAVDVRDHYLRRAKRGYGVIGRDLVQRPKGQSPRASLLAQFVSKRRESALEAVLMLHSLEPVLRDGNTLPMKTWAGLIDPSGVMTPNGASKVFRTLEDMHLVARTSGGRSGTAIQPLVEDGSGEVWKPHVEREKGRQAFFTLPFEYWTEGYSTQLKLAGKAVLLILLAESQKTPGVQISIERFPEWYGISESSAQRGYDQLDDAGVLFQKKQRIANKEVPGGYHYVYHRALTGPFSTTKRQALQKAAKKAGDTKRAAIDT